MTACEVSVRGRLSGSVEDVIRSRFGAVLARYGPGDSTTVLVTVADPAAQRALLTLLWDTGHDVLALRAEGEAPR